MVLNEFTNKVARNLGLPGFSLCESRTNYKQANPSNYTIFGSRVSINNNDVWYGDLDLTKSGQKLKQLAVAENVDIHVLYENDANNKEAVPAVKYLKNGDIKYLEQVENKYKL